MSGSARLDDTENVVAHAAEVIASGELGGAIGCFGYRDDDWYISRITRKVDLHVYENGRPCALALLVHLRGTWRSVPLRRQRADDVSGAVEEAIALGGRFHKAPALYPSDEDPVIEWAVMLDPFGNEFCLIRDVPPPNGLA